MIRLRPPAARRLCSYVVVLDEPRMSVDDVRDFAAYLSGVGVAGCEVIVVDDTAAFAQHRRVLRWVGQHVAPLPRHRALNGAVDPLRAAVDVASCEKVIVASPRVRYAPQLVDRLCSLLDQHEVVEPQDYFDPLPWWGGIDAGRMLLHRGIEPLPDHGSTFAFRRGAIRGLCSLEALDFPGDDCVRRLQEQGAEILSATDLFVRCEPPQVSDWIRERPRLAGDDFVMPVKTAFFFALLPLLALLASFGGARLATSYGGALLLGSVALALRGRAGASPFFPLRACLYAPLWVLERSVSVYWALLRKMSGAETRSVWSAVAQPPLSKAVAAPPHSKAGE